VSRSQIDTFIWQGEEPERACTPDVLGDVDVLVLCHAEHEEPWERFKNRGLSGIIEAPFSDDCKTLDERGLSQAIHASFAVWLAVRSESRVLVTCHRGLNRSGLVVALALRGLKGWSGARALEYVRSKRPGALFNPGFAAYLTSLEAP